ncbi:MAG TPA: N-acetylglucosamine-6-phosphate deacetylase [Propionibacteriaceae bacterium]|nr:N-acetylglucosamine-6-phosphate deacetylase [Propionibacteriaceae bacterium]
MKLASTRVITGTAPEPCAATLTLDGAFIASVALGIDPGAELLDGVLMPGYVDTHSHGAAGGGFASPDPEAVQRAIDHHRFHGTTTQFASTVTESIDDLVEQVRRLKAVVESGELRGIHLEGPFLALERKGAHDPALLRDPAPDDVARLIEAGGDALTMVTLAPEREHGLEAVRAFRAAGVEPAFGHSDADDAQVREAIDAGASVVTHLFNAMRGIHHRLPGPIPWLLTDPRVMVELICDGTHLAPDVVRLAVTTATPSRVALVTDAMSATGQPDGDYELGTLNVSVRSGVARIRADDGTLGVIAGSTLTMDRAVEFLVNQVGCSLVEASMMASTTPARWHGLTDVGELEPGRRADLCLVDERGVLSAVMRNGEWVRR